MGKIWVQVVDPGDQFYQEVDGAPYGPDNKVDTVSEHVRAETIGGKQVPVPMEVTDTAALRRALAERSPINKRARVIQIEDPAIIKRAEAEAAAAAQAESDRVAAEEAAARKAAEDEAAKGKK